MRTDRHAELLWEQQDREDLVDASVAARIDLADVDRLRLEELLEGGKAPHDRAEHVAWEDGVATLAELPNVACKISGLFTEADPAGTAARALRWFGAERCLWGSDRPVCTLAGAYADGLALVADDARVLGGNAAAIYGLR